ncbi:MAG: phage protein Gp37 [Candidatus Sedimenticola sp. (ex Thyasira tokunagai)]
MGAITTIEDQLIATTQGLFGSTLRTVDTVPGAVTLAVLKNMIASAPAVYFLFLGGQAAKENGATINGRFTAYIVSRNRRGPKERRRGGAVEIGIYEILEHLVPQINGLTVPEVGSLKLTRIDNLFSVRLEEQLGAALYAAVFELPNLTLDIETDPLSLDDFTTFNADHDLDPSGDGEPVATDTLTLPQ